MAERIERSVFEELVREHHGAVYRAAARVLGDVEGARDATQEVFLGLLRAGVPEGARDVGAVLRHRAVQRAWARLESERRRRQREERVAMERGEAFEERTVEREDARRRVGRVLAGLPGELRTALALRFGEGLTFAAIAELCGCSEPTAHDRVRRGLERMKVELGRAGLAGLAPGLPELLGRLEPPPVPSGLESTLLGLTAVAPPGAALSVAATAAWTAAGLGAAVLAAAVLAPRWFGPAEGTGGARSTPLAAASEPALAPPRTAPPMGGEGERVRAAVVGERVALGAVGESPAGAAGERADPSTSSAAPGARVEGSVEDGFARPIEGAEVALRSFETHSKMPRFERHGTSDAQGRFELEARFDAFEGDEAPRFVLRARAPGRVEHLSAPFELAPGARLRHAALRLLADSDDPAGDFELVLHLVDGDGIPAADVLVVLERRRAVDSPELSSARPEPDDEGRPWIWTREDSRRSDERGRIELAGAHLGLKRARLVPARPPRLAAGRPELAPTLVQLEIGRGGRHERVIELEAGAAIVGRLRTVDGSALPEPGPIQNQILAIGPPGESWYSGQYERDGSFRIGGLAAAPHELRIALPGFSSVTFEGPVPGPEPLDIRLKRAADPRAIGDHDAELHGRVFDAVSGQPVAVSAMDVLVEQLWGEELGLGAAELEARRAENPRVYQSQRPLVEPAAEPELHLGGLKPGTYALWVEAPGYARRLVGIYELERGQVVADIQVPLVRRAE